MKNVQLKSLISELVKQFLVSYLMQCLVSFLLALKLHSYNGTNFE